MTAHILIAGNGKAETYAYAVDHIPCKSWLKDGCYMVMPDKPHSCHYVETLINGDGFCRVADPQRMNYPLRVECKAISVDQAIALSKISNISTAFL